MAPPPPAPDRLDRGIARCSRPALALLAALAAATGSGAETITLRSGNGAPGLPDAVVHFLDGPPGAPLRTTPFAATDFAAACSGAPALVIDPHPAWLAALPGDPLAGWIGVDPLRTPDSALYCHPFTIAAAEVCGASLDIAYAVDDTLGDPLPGPNLAGVYLNGTPLTAMSGGDFTREYRFADPAVAALLRPGLNQLHVYQRDVAQVVAGLVYSATLRIVEPPTAAAGPDRSACAGANTLLDGAGSSDPGCLAGLEYRWLEGATPLGPWGTTATAPVSPATTTTYTLEVRCAGVPDCVAADLAVVNVYPFPTASAGPDQSGCAGDTYLLTAGATTQPPCAPVEYRWRDGPTVIRDWSLAPAVAWPVATSTTFSCDVRCAAAPACLDSDDLRVEVRDCTPLAVAFATVSARRDGRGVSVGWTTLEERDTLGFELWARDAGGRQERLPIYVEARGGGSAYAARDERAAAREPAPLWYRVVERTSDGAGSMSEWVTAPASGAAAGGRSRRPR